LFTFSQENKIASKCGNLMAEICASYKTNDNVRRKHYPDFIAVVVTGSIHIWSIYFDSETFFCDINKQIEVRLNLFKDKVMLKRHSIGFMFTRNRTEMFEPIVEQEIFKRLFPEVPLVVCYNNGFCEEIVGEEIGEEIEGE